MFTEYSLLGGWSILARLEYTSSLIHARIAFIGGELKQHVAVGRYQGYLDGLQKQNVC